MLRVNLSFWQTWNVNDKVSLQVTPGRTCSLLLLTAVLDDTCLLLLWDYDKTWSISLSVPWMSDWLWGSDLRRLCSRCLLVDQGPGLWLLSSELHIPADTHIKQEICLKKNHLNCANSGRHKALTFPRFESWISSWFFSPLPLKHFRSADQTDTVWQ